MPEDQPSWDEKMQAIRKTLEIAAHQSMKNSDDIAELRRRIAEQKEGVDALVVATQSLLHVANSHQSRIEKLERRIG